MSKYMKEKKFKKINPLKPSVKYTTLPDGRSVELYFIPQLGYTIGICPQYEKSPIALIVKDDNSLMYYMTTNGPVAKIATKNGSLVISTTGMRFKNEEKVTVIPLTDSKQIVNTLAKSIVNDSITQSALALLPGAIITATSLACLKGTIPSINIDFMDIPNRILDCTEEWVEAIYETVNKTVECMEDAYDDYDDCWDDCSGWRKWPCRADCTVRWLAREVYCLGLGIVRILVQAGYYVTNCIITQGLVTDGTIKTGDIILFDADSIPGYAIDAATCGYGYSHVGLVCGKSIIEARSEGVVENPSREVLSRSHEVIRLGLSDQQIEDLCQCVRSKDKNDFDYIEAITFGTYDDPGREMCTMLIMHCLDEIGFNRAELGLGGFVSPNQIARNFGAPRGG